MNLRDAIFNVVETALSKQVGSGNFFLNENKLLVRRANIAEEGLNKNGREN
jgi:hypothetical protein